MTADVARRDGVGDAASSPALVAEEPGWLVDLCVTAMAMASAVAGGGGRAGRAIRA